MIFLTSGILIISHFIKLILQLRAIFISLNSELLPGLVATI